MQVFQGQLGRARESRRPSAGQSVTFFSKKAAPCMPAIPEACPLLELPVTASAQGRLQASGRAGRGSPCSLTSLQPLSLLRSRKEEPACPLDSSSCFLFFCPPVCLYAGLPGLLETRASAPLLPSLIYGAVLPDRFLQQRKRAAKKGPVLRAETRTDRALLICVKRTCGQAACGTLPCQAAGRQGKGGFAPDPDLMPASG